MAHGNIKSDQRWYSEREAARKCFAAGERLVIEGAGQRLPRHIGRDADLRSKCKKPPPQGGGFFLFPTSGTAIAPDVTGALAVPYSY